MGTPKYGSLIFAHLYPTFPLGLYHSLSLVVGAQHPTNDLTDEAFGSPDTCRRAGNMLCG